MNHTQPLEQLLQRETALVQEFIDLLEREAELLLEGIDDADLADSTARKNALADTLTDIGREREAQLLVLGFDSQRAGLEAAAANHTELAEPVRQLLELASRAGELNRRNGLIIDTYIANNQQMLEALRNLVGEGTIYDARGRKKPGGKGGGHNIKAG